MVDNKLQTEMLMELIFSSNKEDNDIQILKDSLPVYLRKLNCFVAGVLKHNSSNFEEVILFPYVAQKSEDWNNVKAYFLKLKQTGYFTSSEYVFKNSSYYAYKLNDYGFLILGRKKPFTKALANELIPIVNQLGKKLVLVSEIEQRKIVEKELIKAKEEAEKSELLKSAFLANISHEIRTPMNGVLGFTELLKTPNLSEEKKEKFISLIEKSGERMLNLINDIIDISKIEANLTNVYISEVNINEQIDSIFDFFNPEVNSKGLILSINKPLPTKESIFSTDLEKFYAILVNLVKNAIKYTNVGTIEIGYYLRNINKDIFIEFYVKDTGIGIPSISLEAVFERFIQADMDPKYVKQGTGLGLSISKAYVQMLNGNIWVESEENLGSTFYFNLPFSIQ